MLEGVTTLDLSGVTGHIDYVYNNSAQYVSSTIISLGILFFLILLGSCLLSLCSTTKTKKYREQLVDMYVSATIRKYATEDKLDLDAEYQNFVRDSKKRKLNEKELSKVVEEELSEKVIVAEEKKLNTKK